MKSPIKYVQERTSPEDLEGHLVKLREALKLATDLADCAGGSATRDDLKAIQGPIASAYGTMHWLIASSLPGEAGR